MDIKGVVHEVAETQQISETFKKRDFVLEYAENPTYPEYIRFELLQDKVALAEEILPGDSIEVFFNLRGRPWTDKNGKTSYFNSLVCWKMNILQTAGAGDNGGGDTEFYDQSHDQPGDDDLPF